VLGINVERSLSGEPDSPEGAATSDRPANLVQAKCGLPEVDSQGNARYTTTRNKWERCARMDAAGAQM
jgi:hypothetical protein